MNKMEGATVCYIVMVHRGLEMVRRIVGRLDGEGVRFLVHADLKSMEDFGALEGENGHVRMASRRFDVKWGGMEQVEALMGALGDVERLWGEARYVVLLSGNDYPVKRGEEIGEFFAGADKDFIIANRLPCDNPLGYEGCRWAEGGRRRVECEAVRLSDRGIALVEPRRLDWGNVRQLVKVALKGPGKLGKALGIALWGERRVMPEGMPEHCGGEFWFALRMGTVRRVLAYCREHGEFMEFHRKTGHPDEIVMPSLVNALVDRGEIACTTLRRINWGKDGGASPGVYTTDDAEELREAIGNDNTLFVRKVELGGVTDLIDTLLDGKEDSKNDRGVG